MHHPRSRRGFTLPETLIALTLFMLCAGVLGESMNIALHQLTNLQVKEGRGTDFAFVREQILSISDYQTFLAGGTVMTQDAGEAEWTVDVTPSQTAYLFKVDLDIKLPGSGNIAAEEDRRTLFLLRPAWADPTDTQTALQTFHDNLQKIRTAQSWP